MRKYTLDLKTICQSARKPIDNSRMLGPKTPCFFWQNLTIFLPLKTFLRVSERERRKWKVLMGPISDHYFHETKAMKEPITWHHAEKSEISISPREPRISEKGKKKRNIIQIRSEVHQNRSKKEPISTIACKGVIKTRVAMEPGCGQKLQGCVGACTSLQWSLEVLTYFTAVARSVLWNMHDVSSTSL